MQHADAVSALVITRRLSVPCFRELIALTRRSLVALAEVASHLLPARPVLHPGRQAVQPSRENPDVKMRTHRRDI